MGCQERGRNGAFPSCSLLYTSFRKLVESRSLKRPNCPTSLAHFLQVPVLLESIEQPLGTLKDWGGGPLVISLHEPWAPDLPSLSQHLYPLDLTQRAQGRGRFRWQFLSLP